MRQSRAARSGGKIRRQGRAERSGGKVGRQDQAARSGGKVDSQDDFRKVIQHEELSYVFLLYHIPNYILAMLAYTMLGRLLLLAVPIDSDFYIARFFRRITDPVLNLVRLITPSVVPFSVLLIFASLWLFIARMIWHRFAEIQGFLPIVQV